MGNMCADGERLNNLSNAESNLVHKSEMRGATGDLFQSKGPSHHRTSFDHKERAEEAIVKHETQTAAVHESFTGTAR